MSWTPVEPFAMPLGGISEGTPVTTRVTVARARSILVIEPVLAEHLTWPSLITPQSADGVPFPAASATYSEPSGPKFNPRGLCKSEATTVIAGAAGED